VDNTAKFKLAVLLLLTPVCLRCQNNNRIIRNFIPKSLSSDLSISVISITNPNCNFDGSIIITGFGGVSPYTYFIKDNPPQNTGNFPNLDARTFDVFVMDAIGNKVDTAITLINKFNPPTSVISGWRPPTTCDASDGSVTISSSGGTPPYLYSMDLINFQSSNVFSNLPSGFYNRLYMIDANGCMNVVEVPLSGFNAFLCRESYAAALGDIACGNDAAFTFKDYGDKGPYQYAMDNGVFGSIGSFQGLGPGKHIFQIKDAFGQIKTFAMPIAKMCNIRIEFITQEAACQQNDGQLTINAINGSPPYKYSLDGINYQTSNLFTGLASGNYFATVMDAQGNKSSAAAAVTDRCPIVHATSTNESCAKKDGTVVATGYKGTTPYRFSIDGTNFQLSNTFIGLSTGSYIVTVKDANGFTSTAKAVVNNGCVAVMAFGTNASCGRANGQIMASAANGTEPYKYSLDAINFQSENYFNNVAPGVYTVTVMDVTNKTGTATVTINNIAGPSITTSFIPASCSKNDGKIQAFQSGGTAPFSYSLDGKTFQSSNEFTSLVNTNYAIFIKDGNGCQASQNGVITIDCPVINAIANDEHCDKKDGSIIAVAGNATPPYMYSLDGASFQSSGEFDALPAGAYTVTVKDYYDHTNTAKINIGNKCPVVNAIATDGYCGTSKGSINANAANGTAPYTYSIDGIRFQSDNVFSGLPSGSYTVTTKDAENLTSSVVVSLKNYPSPEFVVTGQDATCLNNDGVITMQLQSGSAPMLFDVDDKGFANDTAFTNQTAGQHTIIAKDVNGCLTTQSIILKTVDNLTLSVGESMSICEGDKIAMNISSNANSYQWAPSSSLSSDHIQAPVASPVVSTNYAVTASLGVCEKSASLMVVVNPAPVANAGSDVIICFGQDTQLDGTASAANKYVWTPSSYLTTTTIANPIVVKPTETITYSLQVQDTNGCKSLNSETVTVIVTPPAKLFAGNDTSIVSNQPFRLFAKDVNSSGFINYVWSPSDGLNNNQVQNPTATIGSNITYTVTANTANGCEGKDDITIQVYKKADIYMPNAFTPNGDGENDIFKPVLIGIKQLLQFEVYNRFGQRIFSTTFEGSGWDGKINGALQNSGTYVWNVSGMDYAGNLINKKGSVILIR
jgi:gliding motility-associated-like protein